MAEREAISLTSRLQPGDSKTGIDEQRSNGFCWQQDHEKPLETAQEIILWNFTTGLEVTVLMRLLRASRSQSQ